MRLMDSSHDIPYGLCKCGCGQAAPICRHGDSIRGCINGEPFDFVKGHHTRITDHRQRCGTCGGSLVITRSGQIYITIPGGPLKPFRIPDTARLPGNRVCPACAKRIKDDTPSRKGQWPKEQRARVSAIVSAKTKGVPKPQPNSPSGETMRQANDLYASGRYTQRQIAGMFGLDTSAMCRRLDPSVKSLFPKRRRRESFGYPDYDDRTWYIYTLVDPRTKDPRYVGWTLDRAYRLQHHIAEAKSFTKSRDTYKSRWISSLLRDDLLPEMVTVQEGTGPGWQEAERFWIAKLRGDGKRLTNLTDGGQGNSGWHHTNKSREKISIKRRNRTPLQVGQTDA